MPLQRRQGPLSALHCFVMTRTKNPTNQTNLDNAKLSLSTEMSHHDLNSCRTISKCCMYESARGPNRTAKAVRLTILVRLLILTGIYICVWLDVGPRSNTKNKHVEKWIRRCAQNKLHYRELINTIWGGDRGWEVYIFIHMKIQSLQKCIRFHKLLKFILNSNSP